MCVYMYESVKVTILPDGKLEQDPRAVAAIFIVHTDRASMQHGDPNFGGLLRSFCLCAGTHIYFKNCIILVMFAKTMSICV